MKFKSFISKRYFVLLTLLVLLFVNTQTVSADTFAGGTGTINDPWIISTCLQLESIDSDVEYLNDYFKLVPTSGDTLDCTDTSTWDSGNGFSPIGDFFNRFTGTFDGQNNKISNLFINRTGIPNVGLFGVVDEGGLIKKLGLENVTISGGLNYTGAMVGSLSGRIENSYATGVVNGNNSVGGLVGIHTSTLSLPNSSPLVYTWNGLNYKYVADVGEMILRTNYGLDLASIDSHNLAPKGDKYSMKISEEYNEIVYFDQLALMTFDHIPGYTVVAPVNRDTQAEDLITISDTPTNPLLSCTDKFGNDCLDSLKDYDDKWSYKDESFVNEWTLDFGDLSNKDNIQFVMRGARDFEATASGKYEKVRDIQVKDTNGNWVTIYDKNDLASDGTPRLRTIDLKGKFLSNDYHVRVKAATMNMNYVAIDTSPQVPVTVHTYHPTKADLQFQGFTDIDKTYFFDHDYSKISQTPKENFANQYGNFTKYGDVSPLLESTNDQFVVMRYGDTMDIEFPYVPVPEGQERSFILYNDALYKHASNDDIGLLGRTVDPLPYQGMTEYSKDIIYPMTSENTEYLKTWNTRTYSGNSNIGGSTIVDSHADADVTGSTFVGGLVGYNDKDIIRSYTIVDIEGFTSVGGLVGMNITPGTITDSYSIGVVNGTTDTNEIGGLIGYNTGNVITSYSSSTVVGDIHVGGLFGYQAGLITDSSYSAGSVEGNTNVGGIIGLGSGNTPSNSGWVVQDGLSPNGGDAEETATYNEATINPFYSKTHGVYTAGDNTWDFDNVWEENDNALPTLYGYPTISSKLATSTQDTVTITFNTNKNSTSTIAFGLSDSYGSNIDSGTNSKNHSAEITGLTCGSAYHYQILLTDGLGNDSISDDSIINTEPCPVPVSETNRTSGGGSSRRSAIQPPTIPVITNDIPSTSKPRDLTLNSEGNDVKTLQIILNIMGYTISPSGVGSPNNESDYFGEKTKQALIKFQKDSGITPAEGYFGSKTRDMLILKLITLLT